MSISPIKTPQQMILDQAGIPHLQAGGKPTPAQTAAMKAALAMGALRQQPSIPKDMPEDVYMPMHHGQPEFYYFQDPAPVNYYRRGTIPKHTTKEGLETTPSTVDANQLRNWISVMRAGEKHGVPQFTPEQLTAMLFKEGRTNLGYNQFNYRDPKSLAIYRKIVEEGYDPNAAGFASAVYDAHQKAKQFGGNPFNYWFGTGVSEDKQTSPQYLAGMKKNLEFVLHPKNAQLYDIVQDAYHNPVPPPPIPTSDHLLIKDNEMPAVDIMGNVTGHKKGGKVKPFRDMSRVLIQKHIGK